MAPGDLVAYHGGRGDPKPAQLLRFLGDKRAVIMLAGQERNVCIRSLRVIDLELT